MEVNSPINMSTSTWFFVLLFLFGALAFWWRQRTNRQAHKKIFRQGGGNIEDFREYREWLKNDQARPPTRSPYRPYQPSQPIQSTPIQTAQPDLSSLLPLLQLLTQNQQRAPAVTHLADPPIPMTPMTRLPDQGRQFESPPPPASTTAAEIHSIADPAARRAQWDDIS